MTNGLGQIVTESDGFFSSDSIPLSADFDIVPSRTTGLLDGVTTFDIVLINRHILDIEALDSPYKLIAADINASGSITVFDLVLIQRVILSLNDEFTGNTSWRFIPSDHVFPDPTNPFTEPFPELRSIDGFVGNFSNQDFIGVKVGDVSYIVPGGTLQISESRSKNALALTSPEYHFAKGEVFEVPLELENISDFSGFQLELNIDPSLLELQQVQGNSSFGLGDHNVGYQFISQGKVLFSWVAPKGALDQTGANKIHLTFKAKQKGSLSSLLSIGNRFLQSEAYTLDLQKSDIDLTIKQSLPHQIEQLLLYPNPTNSMLTIDLPEQLEVEEIQFLTVTGQLLITHPVEAAATQVQLDLNQQPEGTYLLIVKGKEEVRMERVVIAK